MITSCFALQSPLLAARDRGFFAREGLSVEYQLTRSSTDQARTLLAGEVDVIQTAADNLIALAARQKGAVGIFHVADLGLDQFAVAGAGTTSWEDVRNGRVAVDAADSGYAFVLYKLLEEQGLGRDDYEVVPLGGPQARYESLVQGSSQVGMLNPAATDRATDAGLAVLAAGADRFPGYPNLVFAARAEFADDNRDELAAFSRAISAAVAWAHDPVNAAVVVTLFESGRGMSAADARALYLHERQLRTDAAPGAAEIRAGLGIVADLRNDLTGQWIPVEDYTFSWALGNP